MSLHSSIERSLEEKASILSTMVEKELITTEEAKITMKKRRHYEYQLHSGASDKDLSLTYINFEINLVMLIDTRRKKKSKPL
jgi:membrane carboxypeptidase/penicillin-binding protein